MLLLKKSPKVYTEKSFLYLINYKKVNFNRVIQNKASYYNKEKKIKKDQASFREIYKPRKELKIILKRINKNYLSQFSFSDFIHCGPKGRSVITAAKHHTNYDFHLSLDIESFFDRITVQTIQDVLSKKRVGKNIIKIITDTCCEDNKLPQGFPTSSLLSALVLDCVLSDFYNKFNKTDIVISIYADDILLSSNDHSFLAKAEEYIKLQLHKVGLVLNDTKRDFGKKGNKFLWLGLQLHPWVSVQRKKIKDLQKNVYEFKIKGLIPESFTPKKMKKVNIKTQWQESVLGKIVFMKSIQSNYLLDKVEKSLRKSQELSIIPPSPKTTDKAQNNTQKSK